MKFGQLIEYNMRNTFVEKSYPKCLGETIPRPFLKDKNWAYAGSIVQSFKQFVSNVC